MSVVLYRLPCGVHIFAIWSTLGVLGRTARLSQVALYFLEILLIFLTPCFPRADCYLLTCIRFQLPTPDNSLGSVEFLMQEGSAFRRMKGFHFSSACLRLSNSTSKLSFLVFLKVFGVDLEEITFSMRKGENLARQTSPKDLITMNLENSAVSFSESDCNRFHLVFFIWRRHRCIFFAGPVLHHPPRSPTCVGNVLRGKPIRFGYTTSILELRVGFRAVANFSFSALFKFLFSQRLNATAF